MTRHIMRSTTWALSACLAFATAVAPCAASERPAVKTAEPAAKSAPAHEPALTELSPASRALLARAANASAPARTQPQTPGTSSASSFFKSRRGAVTLVLMGLGTGFTLWSIQHDRKPVKSPVR